MKNKDFNLSKKKVLFTLDDFEIGGVTTFVQQYSKILVENGFEVFILGRKGNLMDVGSFFLNCTIVQIPEYVKIGFFNRFLGIFKYLYYLNFVLNKYDINIIHFSITWSTVYCLFHPLVWTKRRFITFYGAYDLEYGSTAVGKSNYVFKAKNTFRKFLQTISLIAAERIVTFSKYAESILEQHFIVNFKKKVNIIAGLVDDDNILLPRNLKNKENKEIILVNFGRAEQRKGLDLLLNAIKILVDNHKIKLKAYIASPVHCIKNSSVLDTYEELRLFEKVHFLPKVSFVQKKYLLSNADLFVMPSQDLETFGMTIIESLSQGVPVIGTPVGAIPDILRKVDKQLVCKSVDAESLAKSLLWYINLSQNDKQLIKEKSLEVVQKYYSLEKNKNKLLKLYI